MNKRTLTAAEINRLLNGLAGDDPFDLGGGLTAVRTARGLTSRDKGSPPGFRIDKDGKWGELVEDCTPEEIAAISAALWIKYEPFISDHADQLKPDWILELEKKEKNEAALSHADQLTPDELRDKPDDPNLEPDPTGLKPDWIRRQEKKEKDEANLSHADQLTPDWIKAQEKE